MWGGLSNIAGNLAENTTQFLKQLDETIREDDDDLGEDYHDDDEHDLADGVVPQKDAKEGSEEDGEDYMTTSSKQSVAALKKEVEEVKAMRDGIKSDLQTFTQDMVGTISSFTNVLPGATSTNTITDPIPPTAVEADAIIADLRSQLKEAEERIVDMSRTQTAYNTGLQSTIDDLQEQVLETKRQLNAAHDNANSSSSDNNSNIESNESEQSQAVATLTQQLQQASLDSEAQKEVLINTQNEVEQYIKRNSELSTQLNQMTSQVGDMQSQMEQMQSQLGEFDSLKSSYETIKTQHEAMQADYDNTSSQLSQMGDYDTLKSQYDSIQASYDKLKNDNDALRSSYDAMKVDYDKVVDNAHSEENRSHEQLQKALHSIEELRNTIKEKDVVIQEGEVNIGERDKEIASLNKLAMEAMLEKDDNSISIEQHESEMKALREDLENVKLLGKENADDINKKAQEILTLQTQVQEDRKLMEQYRLQYKEEEEKVLSLTTQHQQVSQSLEQLQLEHQESMDKYEEQISQQHEEAEEKMKALAEGLDQAMQMQTGHADENISHLNRKLQMIELERNEAVTEKMNALKEVEEKAKANEEFNKRVEVLSTELKGLQENMDKHTLEMQEKSDQLRQKEVRIVALEGERDQCVERCSKQETEVKIKVEALQSLQTKFDKMKTLYNGTLSKAQDHNQEKELLQEKLDNAINQVSHAETEARRVEQDHTLKMTALKEELSALKSSKDHEYESMVTSKDEEIAVLKAEVDTHSSNIDSHDSVRQTLEAQITTHRQNETALQEQIDIMQSQLKDIKDENLNKTSELYKLLADKDTSYNILKTEVEQHKRDLEALLISERDSKDKAIALEEEKDNLSKEIQQHRADVIRLQASEEDSDRKINIINEEREKLLQEMQKHQSDNDAFQKTISGLEEELNGHKSNSVSYEADIVSYQKEIELLKKSITNHETSLENMKNDYEKQLANIDDTRKDQESQMHAIQTKLHSEKEEYIEQISVLNKEITTLKSEMSTHSTTNNDILAEMQSQLENIHQDKSKLEDNVHDLQNQLNLCQQSLDKAQSTLTSNDTSIKEKETVISERDEEIGRLKEGVKALKEAVTELTSASDEDKKIILELRGRETDNGNALSRLKTTVNEMESQIANKETEIRTLEKQIDSMNDNDNERVLLLNSKIEKLEQSLSDKVVENANLHEEKTIHIAKYENMQSDMLKVTNSHNEQETQLTALKQENERLSSNMTALFNEKDFLLKEYETEINSLRQQVEQFNALQNSHELLTNKSGEAEDTIKKLNLQCTEMRAELNEAILRRDETEEQLKKLEQKKQKDLENLKAQNQKIMNVQREKVDLMDQLSVIESNLTLAKQQIAVMVTQEQYASIQKTVSDLTEEKASLEKESTSLKNVLQKYEASEGARADSESLAQSMREAHQSEVDKLNQQITHLFQQLQASEEAIQAKISTVEQLQTQLTSSNNTNQKDINDRKAQANRIEALEQERRRLENELNEAHNQMVSSVGQPSVRSSLSTNSNNPSSIYDIEGGAPKSPYGTNIGGADDIEGGGNDDGGKSKSFSNSLINTAMTGIWTQVALRAPALLRYVGDRPPRLGPIQQGILIYFLLLHLLILFRII